MARFAQVWPGVDGGRRPAAAAFIGIATEVGRTLAAELAADAA